MQAESHTLVAGSTIDERYRLISLIGEGGMASVWRAEDYNLKRAVAIKLLYLGPHRDTGSAVEQFLREARIAAAVQHRNVIHTMDFGTTQDGVPYMVMELLQGENLADRMLREPVLRVDEWVRIAEMTLRGLAAVHEADIIHRDLKPQNIFLQRDSDGVYPKILDFGISRSSGQQQLASPITTQAGFVIGTPHYMAPEQASGEGQIDHRADIYSVGTILYEGLSGRLPFEAETTSDLLRRIVLSEPTPLRELVPTSVEMIADCVSQAMARNRDERFADARAFRAALTRAYELSFPTSTSVSRSGLPVPPLDLQKVPEAPLRKAQPQNDATRAAWGDFEGLSGRPAARAARERKDASVPLGAAARERKDASAPLGAAARERKDASVPLGAAARERKDASVPLGAAARERKDASVPLGAAARERKDASVPLGAAAVRSSPVAPAAPGTGEPAVRQRRMSKSQQEAVKPPVPDSAISYPGEGALLGDNPLDAFAGSAASALELDFAPWQQRRPEDPELKEKKPVQQVTAASPQAQGPAQVQAQAAAPARVTAPIAPRATGLWWLLPAALLVLFGLLLLMPRLFSAPPPNESEARAHEANAAATRGSSRVLQRQRVEVPPSARPEQRELLE
ncbi:MAG TPA: protein kinase [Polyangiales bacterium]|nr:protein kinase [Polyangiales bacterium]